MSHYPRPRSTETVAEYQARCLHHDGHTMAEVQQWNTSRWVEFQNRVNPSAGARVDSAYREDMAIRLGLRTGELHQVHP